MVRTRGKEVGTIARGREMSVGRTSQGNWESPTFSYLKVLSEINQTVLLCASL